MTECDYLFSWGKIPGNDNIRLIEYLRHNFSIEWVKEAKINKNDNSKTIIVKSDTNFLSLTLNDDKTNINLEIDDGRTDQFIVKTENGELNIYEFDFNEYLIQLNENEIKTLTEFNTFINTIKIEIAPGKISPEIVKIPEEAIAARKLALCDIKHLNKDSKIKWQHYWMRCCLSEKTDYIFSILTPNIKDFDREEDLKFILNKGVMWKYSTTEGRQYYISICIDFLLKRYNWLDSIKLYINCYSKHKINLIKLLLPRMMSAIIIGFLPIVTSNDIRTFAFKNQSNLLYYSVPLIIVVYLYMLYDCHKKTIGTISKIQCLGRPFLVLLISLFWAIVFSTIAVLISKGEWCWNRVFFYAAFALFVGIMIQILWEEKSATEPL